MVGLIILLSCWKNQRLGRLLMLALFIWAGITNWYMAIDSPEVYVNYAHYAFLPVYRTFIAGWFSQHVVWVVGPIATLQVLIGVSMALKGPIYRLGTLGGMIFLVAIIPLGVSSGFPFPIVTAIAFLLLFLAAPVDYLWKGSAVAGKRGISRHARLG